MQSFTITADANGKSTAGDRGCEGGDKVVSSYREKTTSILLG